MNYITKLNKKTNSDLNTNSNADLIDFIESDLAIKLSSAKEEVNSFQLQGHCPFDDHDDNNPSFGITKFANGVIAYNCLGCKRHGNLNNLAKHLKKTRQYNALTKTSKNKQIVKPIATLTASVIFKDEATALKYVRLETYQLFKNNKMVRLLFFNDDFFNQFLINKLHRTMILAMFDVANNVEVYLNEMAYVSNFIKEWLWDALKNSRSIAIRHLKKLNLIPHDINEGGMLYKKIGYTKRFTANVDCRKYSDTNTYHFSDKHLLDTLNNNNQSYFMKYKAVNSLFDDKNIKLANNLNNKLVLPITDILNNVVGYIGVDALADKQYKYLYSKNFKRGYYFYSLIDWMAFNNKKPLVICEGARDVWSAYKKGYQAVALLGSSITKYQAQTVDFLMRHGGAIVIAMDHDENEVGQKATPLILKILKANIKNENVLYAIVDYKKFYQGKKDLGELLNFKKLHEVNCNAITL